MRLRCQTADLVHIVNLQFGEKMDFPAVNCDLRTWEDTTALISQLDAVITVDTRIMNLAGGVGKPMAVLLSGNSCCKFMKTGELTPCYPTAKLYRNDGHGFEGAINKLVVAIRNGTA